MRTRATFAILAWGLAIAFALLTKSTCTVML